MSALEIILGNVFTLIANGFSMLNGTRKKKRDMILCDMGSAISFTISDFVLKGYSGVVQNLVGLARNLTTLFMPDNKWIGWVLTASGVIFGVYFNNLGIIGLLPVATCFYYSICVINPNIGAQKLKRAFIINNISFAIYCIALWNIVGLITNSVVCVTAVISYFKVEKELKSNQ